MGKIKVVGLGPGDIEQLPFGVYQLLKKEKPLEDNGFIERKQIEKDRNI